MAKKELSKNGNRKRSNQPVAKAVEIDKLKLTPVQQNEANLFQQLIQISNLYGKLKKQKAEYEMVLASMKDKRKDVQKGKVTEVMLPFGKNKFYPCTDKKYILKELDAEIDIIANALNGVIGQLTNYNDAFIEQGLAIKDWCDQKFSIFKPKNVYRVGCNPNKDEKVLFEGELDELLKNEEKKKEFQEAKEKAVKENRKMQKVKA